MSFDYATSAATAARLLTKFGQVVMRRHVIADDYDPATGAAVVSVVASTRVGVVLDFDDKARKGDQNMQGLVQVGDKRLLLDPNGAALVTDRYVIQSVEYATISVSELNPAGTVVLYDLHLRRA